MRPSARSLIVEVLAAALFLAPHAAQATSVWADWTIQNATTATATTPDGRSAAYTGHPVGTNAAGTVYNVAPTVPGVPGGTNPPYLGTVTGQPHPTIINPGDLIMSIDLANFPVDAETTWGIADYQSLNWYRLELLDSALNALSFAAVQVTNYNLTYFNPPGFVADMNVLLNTTTGAIRDNFINDAVPNNGYAHSGLALFTNLPLNTRYIRLLSNSVAVQVTEGIQIYLGGSAAVPEPATAWLVAMGVLAVAVARRR